MVLHILLLFFSSNFRDSALRPLTTSEKGQLEYLKMDTSIRLRRNLWSLMELLKTSILT